MLYFLKMQKNRGQTLLESIIALAAIVIVLGAVATAVLISLNNSLFIKRQNQGNKLAQQGMEYIRDRINNGGSATFFNFIQSGTQCFNDFTATPPPSALFMAGSCQTANIQGTFKREVVFTSGSCNTSGGDFVNGLKVTVTVSWTGGKCTNQSFCNKQIVSSCFIDPAQGLPVGTQQGI